MAKKTIKYLALTLSLSLILSVSGCVLVDKIWGTKYPDDTSAPSEMYVSESSEPPHSDTLAPDESESLSVSESEASTEIPTESVSDSDTVTNEQTDTNIESSTEVPVDNVRIVSLEKKLYTYDDMKADLEKLAVAYKDIFSYTSIATTADGREVYAALIGNGNAPNQIVVDAGTHGREWLTPQAVMAVMEYYLSNYKTGEYDGSKLSELFAKTDLYFIPMLNPDGVTISQLGVDGLLRDETKAKVREIYDTQKSLGNTSMSFAQYQYYWKSNAHGVDINRNFPVEGNYMTEIDESGPSHSGYSPSPSSESETVGYMDLVNSLKNPVCVISVHSQGNLIYWDCGQTALRDESRELAGLVQNVTGYSIYRYPSFTAASSDWAAIAKNIPSVTIETGSGNCPLPHSELDGIYSAIRDVFAAITKSFAAK